MLFCHFRFDKYFFISLVILIFFFLCTGELNKTVLSLLGIYLGGSLASMVRSWIFSLTGQRVVARLRSQLFANIMKQEISFFDVTRWASFYLSFQSFYLFQWMLIQLSLLISVKLLPSTCFFTGLGNWLTDYPQILRFCRMPLR